MKRYLWVFLFLASTCYAEVNQTGPRILRSLQKQIETLTQENQQIKQANEQLKQQLVDKDREVERLEALCRKNNIDPNVVRFSFRGAYIGDPKSKMENQFRGRPELGVVPMMSKGRNGLESFRDTSIVKREGLSLQAYLGDIPIEMLIWAYLDDKLVGFSVVAKSAGREPGENVFNQFRDYLIERYGQPDKIEKGTTQNIMGATFPKVILTWYTSDGPMVLENPSGSIDEFSLFMCQRGLEKEFDRRNKEIAEQNADKAF